MNVGCWGTRAVPANLGWLWGMSETVCASNCRGAAASGAHISSCQQLGRLGCSGQLWGRLHIWAQLLEVSTSYIPVDISSLMDLHPALPERGAGWGRWCCLSSCECSVCLPVIGAASHVYIHVVYMCVPCACAYREYICSLATGWTWGHEAAAASPLSGWHGIFSSNWIDYQTILDFSLIQTKVHSRVTLSPIVRCLRREGNIEHTESVSRLD